MLLILILHTLNFELAILDVPNRVLFGVEKEKNQAYSLLFDEIGYESKDFIQNLSLDFYLFFGYFGIALFCLILKKMSHLKLIGFVYTLIKPKVYFAYILRAVLEVYLAFGFAGYIQIYQWLHHSEANFNPFSMFFACLGTLILLLFPLFNLLMVIYRHRIAHFTVYFGVLTERIDTKRLMPSVFNVLFVIRRQLFILVVFYVSDPVL